MLYFDRTEPDTVFVVEGRRETVGFDFIEVFVDLNEDVGVRDLTIGRRRGGGGRLINSGELRELDWVADAFDTYVCC